jgi:murein DD-endopeptidase MepM/ murein hydrolase activator NlpD
MDNNSYQKIGCSSNKTIVVDPNKFDGMDSSDNISVPLEDLSIYVQLETTKRARTVLQNDISLSSNEIKVKFIEGTEVSGRKVLTSRYTDLTTSFDNNQNDGESLGITSIDIDFNSSYAPLVVINFIDLRGSSVFQNEGALNQGNKYATLFQIPYPIFTLTIKGYYGMPVKYDLHLTKFNARFNSKTGNFEITANFVGYTYAMLSDMLIGYLRAFENTNLGITFFNRLKAEKPNLLTLDEFMVAISKIDEGVGQLAAENQSVINYNIYTNHLDIIETLRANLNSLGSMLDENADLEEYKFINLSQKYFEPSFNTGNLLITNNFTSFANLFVQTSNSSYDLKVKQGSIQTYNDKVIELTNNFNAKVTQETNLQISQDDLKFDNAKFYDNLGTDTITSEDFVTKDENKEALSSYLQTKYVSNIETTITDLRNYVIKNNLTGNFKIYDVRSIYSVLDDEKTNLESAIKGLQKDVGEAIRVKIREKIGLDPTVRNIVEIFTASVEVLMNVLFEVSKIAINSPQRKAQLEKFKPTNDIKSQLDYKASSTNSVGDNSASGGLVETYYPWPEYRNYDEKYGLIEDYLGGPNVLKKPSDVTELEFIDNLLIAFLISAEQAEQADIVEKKSKNSWAPVSPLDTKLFNLNNYPYSRFSNNKLHDVINNLLVRAFIYIGVSNYKLTPTEIKDFATSEANLVLLDADDKIKFALSNLTKEEILSSTATINGNRLPLLKNLNGYYYYNFIFGNNDAASIDDAKNFKLLPLNNTNASFNFTIDETNTVNFAKANNVFITNYTTSSVYSGLNYDDYNANVAQLTNNPNVFNGKTKIEKPNDGAIYLKIFNKEDYLKSAKSVDGASSSKLLTLSSFKQKTEDFKQKIQNVEYGQFSGKYGIQEYFSLNFGVAGLDNADYSLLFFNDSTKTNGSNAFSTRRTNTNTAYDTSNTNFNLITKTDVDEITTELNTHDKDKLGQNRLMLKTYSDKKSGVVYPYISFKSPSNYTVGLFGSRFYYEQTSDKAKAFLFLHTLPFNGIYGESRDDNNGVFTTAEIVNTFLGRAGFISAPTVWAAFIGGLLWRADAAESGPNDPIVFSNGNDIFSPKNSSYGTPTIPFNRLQYLHCVSAENNQLMSNQNSLNFPSEALDYSRVPVDELLLQLPDQVKTEFKTAFYNFVSGPWQSLKSKLEVLDGNGAAWKTAWDNISVSTSVIGQHWYGTDIESYQINTTNLTNTYKNIDNYIIFTRYSDDTSDDLSYNYFTELKESTKVMTELMDLLTQNIIISNSTYKIWDLNLLNGEGKPSIGLFQGNYENVTDKQEGIYISEDDLTNNYITTIIEAFKPAYKSQEEKNKKTEQDIFGTDNKNIIKLQLYRTCKNIYDKWIGGTTDVDNLIFRSGLDSRNGIDKQLANKRTGKEDGATPRLIDSFRFVTRSFRDIGDELFINPKEMGSIIKNNPGSSFYDVVSSMLASNYFNFIALPTYINYGDVEELTNMFKPTSTSESFKTGSIGPSFVCVYVGQVSKNLDFKNSEYPNDGVDFQCDKNNNLIPTSAKDFTLDANNYENNVAVFSVNYSQQNQNLFKDVILDQSEFAETAESLKITDEIAQKGAENRGTFAGQNLYNVYSVRSYKTEVEMMGNAMIQPMMYFQLNNIPMFHGAYMIVHVKHSIKPNHMSTVFNGVRIRNVETPIIDAFNMFMPLLDSIDNSNLVGEAKAISSGPTVVDANSLPPQDWKADTFVDPFDNDKTNVLVTSAPGLRSLDGAVNTHKGVDFFMPVGTNLISVHDGTIEYMRYDNTAPYGFGLYVVINHGIIGNKVYKAIYGHMSDIDSKTFGKNLSSLSQTDISQIISGYNPKIKVEKGQIIGKSGGQQGVSYLDKNNKNYDTAGKGSSGAHLHYELRIGESDINVFSLKYVNGIPYLPLNAYAKYKEGIKSNSDVVLLGNNADFWTLLSICSVEAGTPQSRADVAQSIYNRLATPSKPYGKTIKEIIVAEKQYEPTSKNPTDWININDQNSAIIAVKNAKGWDDTQAKKALMDTKTALFNATLQSKAREFVGTRTEFLNEPPGKTKIEVIGVVERTPVIDNNAFFWAYAGKVLKDKTPPQPIDWASLNVNTNIT